MPYKIAYRGGLAGWLFATFAAGGIAVFHSDAFYRDLIHSPWPPSLWIFAAMWALLYLLAGTAAWMVWKTAGFDGARLELALYIAQMIFHVLWSWVFLLRHDLSMSVALIVLHDLLLVATMAAFWRIRPLAAALLLPYLVWVGFAYALTMKVVDQQMPVLG